MQLQPTSNSAAVVPTVLTEAGRSHAEESFNLLDYALIAGLLIVATYSFAYGSSKIRLIALVLSLALGICKPHLLIFALSLASSLEITQIHFFTPMRIVIVFVVVGLLFRARYILTNLTRHHVAGLTYYWMFAMWCVLCAFIRQDINGIPNILTTFTYATICFLLIIVIDSKYSIPTYIWLGLAPTVIACILATLKWRTVQEFEYLITPEGLRYRGIVEDPNYLSSILLVGFTTCLVYLSTKKGTLNRAVYLALSAAFFFAIWVPQSRGGIYTACLCIGLLCLLQLSFHGKGKKLVSLILMISIGILTVVFLMRNTHSRIFSVEQQQKGVLVREITKHAIAPILNNPIFGPGEVTFIKRYGAAPHNTLISIGLEYGVVGMLFMLATIFYSFLNLWKYRKNGSITYYLPLLALNIILCSFSGGGHKLLWFYLVAGAIFNERTSQ